VAFAAFLLSLFRRNRPVGRVEKILFGIGNPGGAYADTRHNAGFSAIDWLEEKVAAPARHSDPAWEATVCTWESMRVALVKPKTYVNRCGAALVACLERMQCPLSSCLVIVDDYHLPLGTIRIRPGGSDGGHNGLKSIIERVGTAFPRLRIGIGPLPGTVDSVQFVLGRFTADEKALLKVSLARAEKAALLFAQRGVDAAMNAYNGI
jgi:peptidyl-tRNA hydrolase, PTH1 family